MVDELPHDHRVGERNQKLHYPPDRNVDLVLHANERRLLPVHFDHLEVELVDAKRVHLIGLVTDSPLLDITQVDRGVDPVHSELLTVDEKPTGALREDYLPFMSDGLLPQVIHRWQLRGEWDGLLCQPLSDDRGEGHLVAIQNLDIVVSIGYQLRLVRHCISCPPI